MADETPLFTGSEASASPTEQDTSPSASTVNPDVMGRSLHAVQARLLSVTSFLRRDAQEPQDPRYRNIRVQIEDASFSTGAINLRSEVALDPRNRDEWEPLLDEALLEEKQEGGSSVIGAAFNVVNLFMGVTLLSIVYAVAQGGLMSFVPLVVAGAFMCLSGCFLGGCLEMLPAGSSPGYPDVAGLIWGSPGRVAAVVFCFMELFGNAAMNLIVMWTEIESLMTIVIPGGLLGLSVHNTAVVFGSAALLPLFLTGNLRTLSYLSLVGIVCTVVITVAVLSLVVVDPGREVFPEGQAPGYDLASPKMLLSAGIFSMALSQHSALPAVRNSLADPSQFNRVMLLSFSTLVLLFGSVGGVGYYYFGNTAHELITTDLHITWIGKVHVVRGFTVNHVLILLVGIQGMSAIPTGIAVLQDLLLGIIACTPNHPRVRSLWAAMLRYVLFFILACLAYLGYDVLGAVEGLIGGLCSMTCSLLLPAVMYSCLRWQSLPGGIRGALMALMIFNSCVLVLVVSASVLSMVSPGSLLLSAFPGADNGNNEEMTAQPQQHSPLSTYTRLYSAWPW